MASILQAVTRLVSEESFCSYYFLPLEKLPSLRQEYLSLIKRCQLISDVAFLSFIGIGAFTLLLHAYHRRTTEEREVRVKLTNWSLGGAAMSAITSYFSVLKCYVKLSRVTSIDFLLGKSSSYGAPPPMFSIPHSAHLNAFAKATKEYIIYQLKQIGICKKVCAIALLLLGASFALQKLNWIDPSKGWKVGQICLGMVAGYSLLVVGLLHFNNSLRKQLLSRVLQDSLRGVIS